MTALPTVEACIEGLASAPEQPATDSCIFLWSHLLLSEDLLERCHILSAMLGVVDEVAHPAKYVVIRAVITILTDAPGMTSGLVDNRTLRVGLGRLASTIMPSMLRRDSQLESVASGFSDPDFRKDCLRVLGLFARKRLLSSKCYGRLALHCLRCKSDRSAIVDGWASRL